MIGRRSPDDAQSFDEAWSGRTPRDEHVAELVRFAEHLCQAAATVAPTPAFRDSLRAQLMTEAASVLVPVSAPSRPTMRTARATAPPARPVRRRLATVTATLVASAGAVGIVASSASALPGEMLYPVKRSVESVELQLHRDDSSRGAFQLEQASERLAEARRLSADGGSVDLIAQTLDDFSQAATDGSTQLFSAYSANGEAQTIQQVNDFAAASSIDLSALSTQLPDGTSEAFDSATDAVTDLATEASTLCVSCTPADVRALAASVKALSTASPAAEPAAVIATKTPAAATDKKPDTSTTDAPAKSTPAPTSRPSATPAPTQPAKTPSLTDLTDPLVGGLLGDDTQPGLVPGLLNGLLNPPK